MKNLKILLCNLTVISLISVNSYCDDIIIVNSNPDTIVLEQGKPAPFSGILFSKSKADSVKNELIDKDACYKQLDLYKSNISLESQQVSLLLNQNKILIEQKDQDIKKEEYSKYFYFSSGILLTGLSIYLAHLALK